MTKQEVIKQAYGEIWQYYKDYVDEYGWVRDRDFWDEWREDNNSLIKIEWETTDNDNGYYDKRRPISLKGIENNNGWIKIESENDLPKNEEIVEYWILDDDEIIHAKFMHESKNWYDDFDLNLRHFPTHYQPIVKPQPPLY